MTDYAFNINGEEISFRADDHFRADVEGVETWHPRAALTIWRGDLRVVRPPACLNRPGGTTSVSSCG